MDESGGVQIRSTGSRGLPAGTNIGSMQSNQNQQEKYPNDILKSSIEHKKDYKRSSIL